MSSLVHGYKFQLETRRMGLWLFILSESFLFVALLSTRFYMQGVTRPEGLNQVLGLGATLLLLISSLTAYRAESHMSNGNRDGFLRNLLITIILGIAFVSIVIGIEWPEAAHFAPISSGFGTVFFVITGMHTFHVLTGLLVLAIVYFQGRKGRFSKEDYWGAEGAIIYWHFVDVVWVFVYPILYLFGS